MAGIKEAIQSILSQIETLTVFQHVRVWNNQVADENDGQLYDFPKPAAFVEVRTPNSFLPLGGAYSQSDITVAIHIVHEQFDAGNGTFEQNFDVFDLRKQLIASLTNFQPSQCGRLFKTAEFQDYDHTNIYHYIVEWMTGLIDTDGVTTTNDAIVEPPINLIINETSVDSIVGQTNEQYREINKLN